MIELYDVFRPFPGADGVGYDLCREEGHGALMSVDLRGHEYTPDEIDVIVAALPDLMDQEGVEGSTGAVEVRQSWRTVEPEDEDGEDYDRWDYWPTEPNRESVAVTRLVLWAEYGTWGHRCAWHPREAAARGIPAAEYLALEPDATVTRRREHRYVYLCRECATSAEDRMEEARRQRYEQITRLRGHGFTMDQAVAMVFPTVPEPDPGPMHRAAAADHLRAIERASLDHQAHWELRENLKITQDARDMADRLERRIKNAMSDRAARPAYAG